MFGRKQTSVTKALEQRVQRISLAPTYAPPRPTDSRFGKRDARAMSWRPATLTFQGGERMDVVVKNISDSGARIEFVRSTNLPERVQLSAHGKNRWAYVTWQTWGVAGLRFVGESESQARGA